MTIRYFYLLAVVFAFAVTIIPHEAEAALPAQPCSELGATEVSDDQQNMAACLYDGSHNLVWKGLVQPAPTVSSSTAAEATPIVNAQGAAASPLHTHWQGWYAGGNVGVADTNNAFAPLYGDTSNLHTYGGTAGLVGGYNQVRGGGLFYGGEADINYMS